jgi:hypothetical protein
MSRTIAETMMGGWKGGAPSCVTGPQLASAMTIRQCWLYMHGSEAFVSVGCSSSDSIGSSVNVCDASPEIVKIIWMELACADMVAYVLRCNNATSCFFFFFENETRRFLLIISPALVLAVAFIDAF